MAKKKKVDPQILKKKLEEMWKTGGVRNPHRKLQWGLDRNYDPICLNRNLW